MYETISIILNALLSGGLVVTLVTIKSIRAKANANAKAAEIDNAQKLLDDFNQFIVQPLKIEVNELRESVHRLQTAVKQIQNCPYAERCPVNDKLGELHDPEGKLQEQKPLPPPAVPEGW